MVQLAKCGSWAMMSGIQWLYEATYRTKTKRKLGSQELATASFLGTAV
jgi:hypothetical protein